MLTRAFLTFLALLLLVPATAGAAVRHVIKGAGFGHGIGMSQYGAYGYALEGSRFKGILAHYYKGTTLEPAPGRPVRVLLQPNDPYIRVRGATSANGSALRRSSTYIARRSGSGIRLSTASGRRVATFDSPLRLSAGGDDPVRLLGPALNYIRDGLYRGAIEVRPDGGGLTAINVIDLDPYVKGVVAGEMPSSWPLEALKVQAVAARTYALATRKTTGTFDQYPDTRSQVYKGVVGESVRSNAAVDETRGLILTYGGQPAVTFYFSTSGGHTENVEFSFIGALSKPWLVGVPDPYDTQSPYHRWKVSFSDGRAHPRPGRARHLQAPQGAQAWRVATSRARAGDRHPRLPDHQRAADPRRSGAARHLAHPRARVELGAPVALRPPVQLGRGPDHQGPGGRVPARASQPPPGGPAPHRRAAGVRSAA